MCPSLDLPLSRDGLFLGWMWLLINQCHRASRGSPKRTAALVVDFDSFAHVGRVANVNAAVRAADDVYKKGIC